MPQLIINAMGPDQPGIVGQLTGHLHAGGANILDSRMVNLRGQFAIILLLEAGEDDLDRFRKTLPQAARAMGLNLAISERETPRPAVTGLPFKLKTYSLDQPGVVARISEVLRSHGVNIEELDARQESAAFDGTTLFLMEMRLTVPRQVAVRQLRAELEKQCEALNCDLDLEPA